MSRVHTIYLIHHSHTDVGYTHDQPVLWDLETRFLDEALALADKHADRDGDEAFRWTVETTRALWAWLETASIAQVERFQALEKAGRIEVTAMFANLTPLFDTDQLIESFQLLADLRSKYGFTVRCGMNCDVNGLSWPIVDLLADLGIEGFTFAINEHFGGAPFRRPNAFWWEGPSGRKILAWNGWTYNAGWRYGIGRDAEDFEKGWWPRIEARLDEIGYPLPVLMIQSYHPFGDNGPAFGPFVDFIEKWNREGKRPRIRLATPSEWWSAVKEHADLLPTYRGDWTDYWNFGSISSAREQGMNRASRARLRTADALAGLLAGLDRESSRRAAVSLAKYREKAWDALHLWDEHTWGADISIRSPHAEDTLSQWYHKAAYAYTARSLSLLLQRDGLAELTRQVKGLPEDGLLVFNPLPWKRVIAGPVWRGALRPRGVADDETSARHFQDRLAGESVAALLDESSGFSKDDLKALRPTEVPAFGYVVVPKAQAIEPFAGVQPVEDDTVETGRYRIVFDRDRGGILSWYDKELEKEWVDRTAGYRFNGFVHEQVADRSGWARNRMFVRVDHRTQEVSPARGWKPGWRAMRQTPSEVLDHKVYETELGHWVVQKLRAPGVEGPVFQVVHIPSYAPYIECESWWEMGLSTHPEATYVLYPFDIPGAVARIDLGGQAMVPGRDQLPGTCVDYYTAQQWVDFSNDQLGVTIALPENPMVQLGDFHFGHNQKEFALERAMLLGWVTNNYWETNFRAHQPGRVRARYRILPHQGGFVEADAHRFGAEAAYSAPALQHTGERAAASPALPQEGSLLALPAPPVMTLHVKRARAGNGLVVRLLNASDDQAEAVIAPGILRIDAAWRLNLLEANEQKLEVKDGKVSVVLPPRGLAVVGLAVSVK